MYTIKEVFPKDDPVAKMHIQQMHHDCFPDYPLIEVQVGWWWIVLDGNYKPVAFCSLWPSVRDKHTGYLARAAVVERARGKGLQKRMIRLREAKARREGYLRVVTDTDTYNHFSSNNMIRCGYTLFEPPVRWSNEGGPWLYWQRNLYKHGVA